MTDRKRGWSAADTEPQWQAVIIPTPVFENVDEKNRWEDAWAETPRRQGESLADHMARVVARARAEAREPGVEG